MSISQFVRMASLYDIIPVFLSKKEVRAIFNEALRAQGQGAEAQVGAPLERFAGRSLRALVYAHVCKCGGRVPSICGSRAVQRGGWLCRELVATGPWPRAFGFVRR